MEIGIRFSHEKTLTNNELLRERIEHGYARYKASIVQLDNKAIFEQASQIACVTEVHTILTHHPNLLDEENAAYLLRFENPLLLLANEWRNYSVVYGADFEGFIAELVDEPETEKDVKVTIINELVEKYGVDMPIFESALLEIVELGQILFPSEETGSCIKGVGFWFKD